MFYILEKDTARKEYKEKISRDIAVLKIMLEKYATNPDQALQNLKEDPYTAYEFINNFFILDKKNPNVSFGNFFLMLTKRKEGNKYYTTSLGLSLIQDIINLLYTDEYVNVNKYQFDTNEIGNEYDVFGTDQAFFNTGNYKSPVVYNSEIVRKYKKLEVDIPFAARDHVSIEQDLKTLYKKLSVSEILTLFYNLTIKAPIVKVD